LNPSFLRTRGFWSSEGLFGGQIAEGGGVVGTFKVAVVKRETDTIKPKALEESSIRIPEKRPKELHHTNVKIQGD